MSEENTSIALSALRSFMMAMNEWEEQFFHKQEALAEGESPDDLNEEYRQALEIIYNRFVVINKVNCGRLVDLGCARPATYNVDSDILSIISSDDKLVVIRIEQTVGLEAQCLIHFAKRNGQWVIIKKESLDYREKWSRAPL
jgi:hypothetical protein